MYQKACTKCYAPSFSSSEIGEWICPVCGTDLTIEVFLDALTREPVHVIYNKNLIPPIYSIKKISKNYRKRIGLSYYSKKSSTINNNFL